VLQMRCLTCSSPYPGVYAIPGAPLAYALVGVFLVSTDHDQVNVGSSRLMRANAQQGEDVLLPARFLLASSRFTVLPRHEDFTFSPELGIRGLGGVLPTG
jgi:hypothetical protein